jgi:hypothetical protein
MDLKKFLKRNFPSYKNMNAKEFLIDCKSKLESMLKTDYAAINPFVEKYLFAVDKMIEIYKNPANQNIKNNIEALKDGLDKDKLKREYNLKDIASELIGYVNDNKREAESLKNAYFHPKKMEFSHDLNNQEAKVLKDCFFLESVRVIDYTFNIGTFGCVLADSLDSNVRSAEMKKGNVEEELLRLLSGLIDIYSNSNAAIAQNKI